MSWVILEGIDGCGKTRLAHALRDAYQWNYEHLNAESGAYCRLANNWRYYPRHQPTLWDRGYVGELVYGPERNYVPDVGSVRMMEALAIEHGAGQLWLRRPVTECTQVVDNRSYAELCLHHERFREVVQSGRLCVPTYSLQSPLEQDLGDFVAMFKDVDEEARRPQPATLDAEGVGARKPHLWLLGEEQNTNAPVQVPFATRVGLEMVWPHVDPRYVRVSNALEREPSGHSLTERWVSLGEPQVVTLGRVARDMCQADGVPVLHDFPHPNYWSRFFSARSGEWHEQLQAVLDEARPKGVDLTQVVGDLLGTLA